jgi:lipoprotein-releasing system ATP-binding protein
MIRATEITKSFGNLQVLKGISLEVADGEVVSVVGASGAGKTTLLQILGTLSKQDSGDITMNGIRTDQLSGNKLARFRNKHIGFVFQFHQLLPEFNAQENVWNSLNFLALNNVLIINLPSCREGNSNGWQLPGP